MGGASSREKIQRSRFRAMSLGTIFAVCFEKSMPIKIVPNRENGLVLRITYKRYENNINVSCETLYEHLTQNYPNAQVIEHSEEFAIIDLEPETPVGKLFNTLSLKELVPWSNELAALFPPVEGETRK
jgi:hypothetical protein